MLAEMPLRFDEPGWLLLLLLLVPVLLVARRGLGGMSRRKAAFVLALRCLVILGLTAALARPTFVREGEGLTVSIILDRSRSIPTPLKRDAVEFLRRAADAKTRPEDRVAVITIARDADIVAMPDAYSRVDVPADPAELTATNLAAGVATALAIMPNDTANRIVLASDGNETVGSVMEAAELALANGVPIDVLVLEYEHGSEVMFEQIAVPARARQGQTVRARMVLRSMATVPGTIRLRINDVPVDLDPDAPGDGLAVVLEPGVTAIEQQVVLEGSGPQRFDAVFEPDDPAADAIDQNNRALGVTFVGGAGRVLVLDDGVDFSASLVRALVESGIAVDVKAPEAWTGGLLELGAYDAVVLANIPRYAIDQAQDRMLHAYCHDLGGGLVMLGGTESFGAGGWIDSQVARAMPVEMNPPQTRQIPSGALALIMHSCEMAQGNFWGQKVAEAAIEALSRLDYAGIVEYGMGGAGAGGIEGCTWAFPMQQLGDKQAALRATRTMSVGDMPAFGPSMQLALNGLMGVPAAQRHAIIISDGDPQGPPQSLVDDYIRNRVTLTGVMVGGHGTAVHKARMRAVATATGGRFYEVTNPTQLPQIFIKEAQIVSRSLIQDGQEWQPSIATLLPGPAQGFSGVPPIRGYVLTAVREGLAQTPILIPTKDAQDPLLANWNYGLGRGVAWTSDLTNRWGAPWIGWERFRAFWAQVFRWAMRPGAPANLQVVTRLEGDEAVVEVEAVGESPLAADLLRIGGIVVRPDAKPEPIALQQTGPGRFRGVFRVDDPGPYLVNLVHESGGTDESRRGTLQAAVAVPYASEYRALRHDASVLRELADRTGGRVLVAGDPALVDLFDATDLEIPIMPQAIWDLLVIVAASILLVDVAARRLAIEGDEVRAFLGRLVGRRVETTERTVEAFKRTKARAAAPATPAEPAARAAPTIDVAAETGARPHVPGTSAPGVVRRPAPEPTVEDDDSMSRLLKAKRRARGDEDGADG